MKTLKRNLLLITLISILTACSDSDNNKDLPALELTIYQETAQDQIGDFACNAMAIHDSKVWSVGGINSSTLESNIDVWNSTNGTNWTSLSNNMFGLAEERCGHTLTTFQNKLWLIGGINNDDDWLGDIWYSENGSDWTNPFLLAPFGAVAYHQTIVYNGKMYVIAGDPTTGNTKVWSTPNGNDWTSETTNAFSGRVSHKAVVFNGAMYVIGGENILGEKLNEIWISTNGSVWTLITNNTSVFPPLNGHTATVYNNKVWIIGGRTNTEVYTNDIYYSNNLIDWTEYMEPNPIDPLILHSTLLYNDALWVFGGFTEAGATGKIWSIKE